MLFQEHLVRDIVPKRLEIPGDSLQIPKNVYISSQKIKQSQTAHEDSVNSVTEIIMTHVLIIKILVKPRDAIFLFLFNILKL